MSGYQSLCHFSILRPFFFLLLVVVDVGFPFCSILLPPAHQFWYSGGGGPWMKELKNAPLTEGKGKKWAVWKITAKVENKPLLEVRCAFCVAKEDWGGRREGKRGPE